MSDVNNPQNNAAGTIDAVLNKYLNEGGDPGSTPTAAPLNFRFGNEQLSVKTVEELQGEVDKRMSALAQAYQQQEQAWQQRLAQTQMAAPTPTQTQPAPEPPNNEDPVAFVQQLVSDPRGTLEKALGDKLGAIEELKTRLERQSFSMAHPFYAANPQVMTGLEKVCQANGMPVTAQNLEMAASWAVSQRYIPDENAFKEQQRQQLMQALQAQQGGNPPSQETNVLQMPPNTGVQNYIRSPHGQYMATPPPPPSTTGVNSPGSAPSRLDMVLSQADRMSPEDLKSVITSMGGNV